MPAARSYTLNAQTGSVPTQPSFSTDCGVERALDTMLTGHQPFAAPGKGMESSVSHIWPIGGGKGGTGKSFLTGSLGFLLAKSGYRTLLIDVDLGAANLHTIVGVPNPSRCLSDFIHRR